MKRRYQCFSCGEIVEREVKVSSVVIDKEGWKCIRCGENKWQLLTEKASFKQRVKNISVQVWDSFTSILSFSLIQLIKFWDLTKLGQTQILTKTTAFLGLSLGIYFLNNWFNCGFLLAAIFILIFYKLVKN